MESRALIGVVALNSLFRDSRFLQRVLPYYRHNKLLDTLNLSVLDKIENDVLRREVGNLVTEGLREEGRVPCRHSRG